MWISGGPMFQDRKNASGWAVRRRSWLEEGRCVDDDADADGPSPSASASATSTAAHLNRPRRGPHLRAAFDFRDGRTPRGTRATRPAGHAGGDHERTAPLPRPVALSHGGPLDGGGGAGAGIEAWTVSRGSWLVGRGAGAGEAEKESGTAAEGREWGREDLGLAVGWGVALGRANRRLFPSGRSSRSRRGGASPPLPYNPVDHPRVPSRTTRHPANAI